MEKLISIISNQPFGLLRRSKGFLTVLTINAVPLRFQNRIFRWHHFQNVTVNRPIQAKANANPKVVEVVPVKIKVALEAQAVHLSEVATDLAHAAVNAIPNVNLNAHFLLEKKVVVRMKNQVVLPHAATKSLVSAHLVANVLLLERLAANDQANVGQDQVVDALAVIKVVVQKNTAKEEKTLTSLLCLQNRAL